MTSPTSASPQSTNPPTLTVDHQARLSGGNARLRELLKGQLTLENPKYRDARKYGRWIGKNLPPRLHFYQENADSLAFPRGWAKQAVLLCRQELGRDPQIIDQRREVEPHVFTFRGQLRPYQQQALEAFSGRDFGVLEAGTGSGKTVVACAVIAARRQPTIILVHTKELLYQWAERIDEFLGVEAGLLGDGHRQLKSITVAIVNSARRRVQELPALFGQLCVDECHRVPSSLFTEVVTAFDCRYMLGLSATAYRRDGLTQLINFYLGDRVHRIDTGALQRSGAILKAQLIQRPTQFRYVYRGNYQALMKALTADKKRNQLIADDIAREVQVLTEGDGALDSGTILVVSDRVQHCRELAELLERRDIDCRVLTGATPAEQRAELVAAIQAGRVRVLISTVQLIGEGFDCPGLRSLFLTTPIKFTGRLLQVVGRILRPAAGKKPKVYDYVDPVGVLQYSANSRALALQ
ncbi:DEAD/DEAH box helicase [Desulfurivibrio dismutans]|uniref:DEAD/DEAH box helicase n=1 Tax=Desulfurivibrio dismutans TaxID=1398908 RepID=UPI0023D9DEAD|nr:DEAD/DEAH box helicase [Desulfurivibrio alkaliphilus]MDF1614128.1 DEAD/DEAH box helicase [Desulfurivibrio alkaliphilus]